MIKTFPSIDRARQFSKGDYLIHISGMVGIATGEVIYEPGNPLEKTKIILNSGFPLIDYCVKFCPATEREKQKSIDGHAQHMVAGEVRPHTSYKMKMQGSGQFVKA